MNRVGFLVTASLTVAAAAVVARLGFAAPAAPGAATAVLAELFTSEGCSSCPPADRLLAMLNEEQPVEGAFVVTLSEHVDYWDHQGWKDPFSAAQFTMRQQAYGRRFNLDGIYTPQLVIDGNVEMVGSDERTIRRTLAAAARTSKPAMRVSVSSRSDQALAVIVDGDPLLDAGEQADLRIALAEDDLTVEVKRGENAQRTLHHVSVVRAMVEGSTPPAGRVTSSGTLPIKPGLRRDKLRVVAFAQARKNGRVLSIGWTRVMER